MELTSLSLLNINLYVYILSMIDLVFELTRTVSHWMHPSDSPTRIELIHKTI